MKITVAESSPERLLLLLRPVTTWGYWLFGALFVGLGIFTTLALGRAVRFECSRDGGGQCVHETSGGPGWTRRAYRIADVISARVDTNRTAISASMLLVVVTRSGDVPIDLVSADGFAKLRLAAELDSFLTTPDVNVFEINEDARPFGWFLGLLLVAAGIVCIVALEQIRVVVDSAIIRISQRRWRRTQQREVAIARLRNVEKHCFTIRYTRSCNVVLVLDGGQEVTIARMPLFTDASADECVRLLRERLGP